MAKGLYKSNREKKKPKQNKKAVPPQSTSAFAKLGLPGNPSQKSIAKKGR